MGAHLRKSSVNPDREGDNARMPEIVLATLNARHAHASLGLRYLMANLGELEARAVLREFVIGQRTEDMAEAILGEQPVVAGFGVYIWNVEETRRLVAQLRVLRPDLVIVLGGPEVSHEIDRQPICALADYVITGWGDVSFRELCSAVLSGQRPEGRVIAGRQPPLDALALPYRLYGEEDIRHRNLYVEASRGCPFRCEFCLSALDRTAWAFPLEPFLAELEALYRRGARRFKFVDRTFNLKVDTSLAILGFFLDKLEAAPDDPVFAHFELVPDHLPERLKAILPRFPPGTLQFEIGIQTFDPEVQARISRRQRNDLAEANLRWLREHTHAHLHVDLIAGLPGETVEQFARGFDRLVALGPQEIQFGILKRLRGAPIARHTQAFGLRFAPDPPYPVLATDAIDFPTFQRLVRFARYWDRVANSGRFTRTLPLLLGESPFARFLAFSDWLWAQTRSTHALAQERLVGLLHSYLAGLGIDASAELSADYHGAGGRARLPFDPEGLELPHPRPRARHALPPRQARHLSASSG